MDWISAVAIIISSIAAVLAWAAKLLWSKEHKEATNRIIQAKDAEIAALKTQCQTLSSLSPDRLRDILNAHVEILESEIERIKHESDKKDDEIEKLKSSDKAAAEKIKILGEKLAEDKGGIFHLSNALSAINSTTRQYLDLNRLFADQSKAEAIINRICTKIKAISDSEKIDHLCLMDEFGPIALGQLSEKIGIPTIWVSRDRKLNLQINPGDRVLFIDDIMVTGQVLNRIIKIINDQGGSVIHALFIAIRDDDRLSDIIRITKIPVESILSPAEIAQIPTVSQEKLFPGRA